MERVKEVEIDCFGDVWFGHYFDVEKIVHGDLIQKELKMNLISNENRINMVKSVMMEDGKIVSQLLFEQACDAVVVLRAAAQDDLS